MKYRLESVIGMRSRARDAAAELVARRTALLADAESELARRHSRLRECFEEQASARARLSADLDRGASAGAVIAHQNWIAELRLREASLNAAVEEQKTAVTRAEGELEEARAKLAEAAKELKAIEKHKSNWQEERRREESRREGKFTDEIGSILHGRREKS